MSTHARVASRLPPDIPTTAAASQLKHATGSLLKVSVDCSIVFG